MGAHSSKQPPRGRYPLEGGRKHRGTREEEAAAAATQRAREKASADLYAQIQEARQFAKRQGVPPGATIVYAPGAQRHMAESLLGSTQGTQPTQPTRPTQAIRPTVASFGAPVLPQAIAAPVEYHCLRGVVHDMFGRPVGTVQECSATLQAHSGNADAHVPDADEGDDSEADDSESDQGTVASDGGESKAGGPTVASPASPGDDSNFREVAGDAGPGFDDDGFPVVRKPDAAGPPEAAANLAGFGHQGGRRRVQEATRDPGAEGPRRPRLTFDPHSGTWRMTGGRHRPALRPIHDLVHPLIS